MKRSCIACENVKIYFPFFLLIFDSRIGEWWIFSNAATDEQMESFVLKLSDILADESRNDDQEVAVNYMKRQITSKNDIIRDHHHRRWLAFTSKTRDQIKQNVSYFICHPKNHN